MKALDTITFASGQDDYIVVPQLGECTNDILPRCDRNPFSDRPYHGAWPVDHGCDCWGDCDCGGEPGWFAFTPCEALWPLNHGIVRTALKHLD